MPPRYQARPTDLLTRVRNEMDALGRPGMAGTSRLGGNRGRGGGQASVVADGTQENDEGTNGAAQLLVMSVDGASIAPGGAMVPFDSILDQHGFDGVSAPSGGMWVHPIGGTYVLVLKVDWASVVAGTIRLLINGVTSSATVLAAGTGDQAFAVLPYRAEEGSTGEIQVLHSGASAQTCDARVAIEISDPDTIQSDESEPDAVETFWYDSRNIAPMSTAVLDVGVAYTIRITGNFCQRTSETYSDGTPNAVMYPSAGQSASNKANADWETRYARFAGSTITIGHAGISTIDLGSGPAHVEPRGGPFTTPAAGHVYVIDVVGEGSNVTFADLEGGTRSDNNGQFKIEIFEGTL